MAYLEAVRAWRECPHLKIEIWGTQLCQTVNKDDELDWRPVKRGKDNDVQFVLRLLRTIRNSLFHGGKYASRPMKGIARDQQLLRAGIDILHECYKLDARIQFYIQEIVELAA